MTEHKPVPPSRSLRQKLDQEQAAAIAGQTRRTLRCPICNAICDLDTFEAHLQEGHV